jgi:hypothetical protein
MLCPAGVAVAAVLDPHLWVCEVVQSCIGLNASSLHAVQHCVVPGNMSGQQRCTPVRRCLW